MAGVFLYTFNSTLPSVSHHYYSSSSSSFSPSSYQSLLYGFSLSNRYTRGRIDKRRSSSSRLVAQSTHSNPKILKSNRRTRYGQTLSPYDSDDEGNSFGEDEEDDWLSDDDFTEMEESDADLKRSKSKKGTSARQGSQRPPEEDWKIRSLKSGQITEGQLDLKNGKNTLERRNVGNSYHTLNKPKDVGSFYTNSRGKLKARKNTGNRFPRLSEELDLDEKWFPLLDYLSTFGLKESQFIQMYERHMPSLQINVVSAQERLEYLLSVGVKQRDIKRMLLRQPQILEYTVESNLKAHVSFLLSLGIPNSRIGHIIASAPSLLSYSVENSLKPTVRYLVEEVGIKNKDLSKVVQLSPQILVQRIDNSWNTRYFFLSKELGAPRDSVVKMVTKHPQLLHYSIEDGLLPRINFLRSIGMRNSDILKVLTSLTQVLSLSLEENLKPKYMYLINELRNEVQSLTKYPMYLSLSLEQRIRPRHRFLVSLKKAPKGPFPLSSLVPTDECFCQRWAGSSLDKYLAFRQSLLLKNFAKKYERKG